MGLFSFLKPRAVFESAQSLYKDISNYLFYSKQIKKLKQEGVFRDLKMRVDWVKRVYYVINLEPETMLATGDIMDLEKSRVYESVSKYQGKFAELNLTEIVDINTKRIKNSDFYAYLVTIKYKVMSSRSDLWNVIWSSVVIYYLVKLIHYAYLNGEALQSLITSILTQK